MRTSAYLDNSRGATMVEATVALILLLFATLAGIDLVRVAYNCSIIQYEVVRAVRLANVEANSSGTGFGAVAGVTTYNGELTYNCGGYGGCTAPCSTTSRACVLRQYIRDSIVTRALSGELDETKRDWKLKDFIIQSVTPGNAVTLNTVSSTNNTGVPGDLLIVDITIPMNLISPLRIAVGSDTVPIRGTSIGRNEY